MFQRKTVQKTQYGFQKHLLFFFVQSDDILYKHTNSDNNLYFVFTTFRHGARFPFGKQDIFGNNINSPGALTEYGALQHLEIGQKYRERYSNFLDMNFDESPFAKNRKISGEEELYKHFSHRQELEIRICRELFPDKVTILESKAYLSI